MKKKVKKTFSKNIFFELGKILFKKKLLNKEWKIIFKKIYERKFFWKKKNMKENIIYFYFIIIIVLKEKQIKYIFPKTKTLDTNEMCEIQLIDFRRTLIRYEWERERESVP